MQLTQRRKSHRGYEHTRFDLVRSCSWEELIAVAVALVSGSKVDKFSLYAKVPEIGAGGFSASKQSELGRFAIDAGKIGTGDLSGTLWVDGERIDFYFGNSKSVGFTSKAGTKAPIGPMLLSAERKVIK